MPCTLPHTSEAVAGQMRVCLLPAYVARVASVVTKPQLHVFLQINNDDTFGTLTELQKILRIGDRTITIS